jgi:hypothetical protein
MTATANNVKRMVTTIFMGAIMDAGAERVKGARRAWRSRRRPLTRELVHLSLYVEGRRDMSDGRHSDCWELVQTVVV